MGPGTGLRRRSWSYHSNTDSGKVFSDRTEYRLNVAVIGTDDQLREPAREGVPIHRQSDVHIRLLLVQPPYLDAISPVEARTFNVPRHADTAAVMGMSSFQNRGPCFISWTRRYLFWASVESVPCVAKLAKQKALK